jgi:hypothetical protein
LLFYLSLVCEIFGYKLYTRVNVLLCFVIVFSACPRHCLLTFNMTNQERTRATAKRKAARAAALTRNERQNDGTGKLFTAAETLAV